MDGELTGATYSRLRSGGKRIQRTYRRVRHIPEHMGIDHGCLQILVAEQALHLTDVHPALEQVRGKAVATK